MYRKNMMFVSGWRESGSSPFNGHVVPFPGDSIPFRLPRQPAGAIRRDSFKKRFRRMACPFLEQQKTPGKEQPSQLLLSGVHIVCLLLGGFTLPALQKK